MVKEASSLIQVVVSGLRGSLNQSSSDYYVYARAEKLCQGTGIPLSVPAKHAHEGHGYPLEEINLKNIPFQLQNNQPIDEVGVGEDAVVAYERRFDPQAMISGSSQGTMVVALRSTDEMTVGLRDKQEELPRVNPDQEEALRTFIK